MNDMAPIYSSSLLFALKTQSIYTFSIVRIIGSCHTRRNNVQTLCVKAFVLFLFFHFYFFYLDSILMVCLSGELTRTCLNNVAIFLLPRTQFLASFRPLSNPGNGVTKQLT